MSPRLPLCLLAAALLAPAQPWPGQIGAGIDAGTEGSRSRMFVDLGKVWRPARLLGSSDLAPIDSDGWPTSDFSTVIFDIRPIPAWAPPIDDPDAFQPDWSGTYRVSFHGQAEVGGVDTAYFTIENLLYDEATNTTKFDLVAAPGAALLTFDFRNTKRDPSGESGTGITALRILRPGYPEDSGKTFTDEFLATLAPFRAIRFMGFLMANNTNPKFDSDQPYEEWIARRLTTDATQQRTAGKGAGIAWEYAVEICNLSGKDMWINIPVAATDSYIRALAALIKDQLKPELKIYLEIGNEVWNPGFTQYTWNRAAALSEVQVGGSNLNEPVAVGDAMNVYGRRRHLRRLHEATKIFAESFGVEQIRDRIRPVHSWWTIRPAEYRADLQWSETHFGEAKAWLYAIAKTNYYNAHAALPSLSPEEIVAYMRQNSDSQLSNTRTFRQIADDFGVMLFAYEAGPDNGGGATANVANRIRANRLPEMAELLKHDFIDNWINAGGDLYMFLEVTSAYSRYGCWGQIEDAANWRTHRMRAIYELAGLPWPE